MNVTNVTKDDFKPMEDGAHIPGLGLIAADRAFVILRYWQGGVMYGCAVQAPKLYAGGTNLEDLLAKQFGRLAAEVGTAVEYCVVSPSALRYAVPPTLARPRADDQG